MSNIAIITARGGSKRIPKKNIRDFCGKPIIAYSIEAALESNVFDEVMVSTDDEEIKNIALQYGAKVPFLRSEKTSNDYAATYEVLNEVLNEYKKMDKLFRYMCCIYPTAPFITSNILEMAMDLLVGEKLDSVLPMVQFSFPPQRGLVVNDGKIAFKWSENALMRSQDLEPVYHDAGQFYCVNVERFVEKQSLIMPNSQGIMLEDLMVQDIDNESDWEMAEFKYRYLHELRKDNYGVIE